MFNSEVLEVAVGLVFVFLVTSLLASAVREMIEAVLRTRAVQLERGLRQMLDDPHGTGITKRLFDHPQVYALFAGSYQPHAQLKPFLMPRRQETLQATDGSIVVERPRRLALRSNMPPYIPSRHVALALMDLVGGSGSDNQGVLSIESLKANAMTLPEGRLRQALLLALAEAGDDLGRVRASLEAWFDGTMDRVAGWYRRETQWILLAIGLVLAVMLNIDSLRILRELSTSNATRQALVARVDAAYREPAQTLSSEALRERFQDLSALIGWERVERERNALRQALIARAEKDPALGSGPERLDSIERQLPSWWAVAWAQAGASTLLGWLLTALAVSLGAPFWFDLLNKVMVIRSTVKPYEKSPPEGSEDRRGAPTAADRLAVAAETRPAPGLPGPEAGETGPAVASVASVAPSVRIRLALEAQALDAGSLRLEVDGNAVVVSPEGFVELPLALDTLHTLVACASRAGRPVRWEQRFVPTLDHEAEPMLARLE